LNTASSFSVFILVMSWAPFFFTGITSSYMYVVQLLELYKWWKSILSCTSIQHSRTTKVIKVCKRDLWHMNINNMVLGKNIKTADYRWFYIKSNFLDNFTSTCLRGICGQLVKVVYSKPLAPHRCGFKSQQRLWIFSWGEANQLASGTSVVLLRCPFMSEIMYLRSSSICKDGMSPYDLYYFGVA
jgi:hypothetical protein